MGEKDELQKCEMAKNAEPNITRAMESMQSDTRHLVGLEHRLKGEGSMSRKILSDAQEMLEKGEVTTFEAGMKSLEEIEKGLVTIED